MSIKVISRTLRGIFDYFEVNPVTILIMSPKRMREFVMLIAVL